MNSNDILTRLRDILAETFEISPDRVSPEAHLFKDLDLDSIDAVDLAIKLQELTGQRIKAENFKTVRTVGDLVTTVQELLAAVPAQAASPAALPAT